MNGPLVRCHLALLVIKVKLEDLKGSDIVDLTFKTALGKFNYRVAAIIIHHQSILMVKGSNVPYYYTVGGRVHFNETAEAAVKREVFEEVGIHLEIDRLVFIHENLFKEEVTGEYYHELCFFFLMKNSSHLSTINLRFYEQNRKEELEWFPLERLENYYMYPEFFKEKLQMLPSHLEHILTQL